MKAVLEKHGSALATFRAFERLSQGELVWNSNRSAEKNLSKLGIGERFKADVTKEFELARLVGALKLVDPDMSLFDDPALPSLAEDDKRLPALAAALGANKKPSRKMGAGAPLQSVMQSLLAQVRKVGFGVRVQRQRSGPDGSRHNVRDLVLPPLVRRFIVDTPDGDWRQVHAYRKEFWQAVDETK